MSNAVCLTAKQQKFYNYFVNYAKSNGMFPTPAQAARDLNCATPYVNNMYGVLLLKGCFTNGNPLTSTYKARHHATPIQPMNVANFKLDLRPKAKVAPPKKQRLNKRQLADLLVKLLSEDKINTKAIAQLIA